MDCRDKPGNDKSGECGYSIAMTEPAPSFTPHDIPPEQAAATLTVDLANLQRNWLALAARAAPAECAGVVKADAYGLGVRQCARALWAAGCRSFFVAIPQEGAELRRELPDAAIYVLDGLLPGLAPFYAGHRLIPCLGSLEEIAEWAGLARARQQDLQAALHVETGINRLGLTHADVRGLNAWPDLLDGLDIVLVMSHFACADDPDSEMNRRQRVIFDRTRELLPPAPASLFNSPATLRDSGSPYDIVRTGVALYGGNPFDDREEPMAPVAHVSAILLQVRDIAPGETVGYGATWRAARRSRSASSASAMPTASAAPWCSLFPNRPHTSISLDTSRRSSGGSRWTSPPST
jgi:alanine racemase